MVRVWIGLASLALCWPRAAMGEEVEEAAARRAEVIVMGAGPGAARGADTSRQADPQYVFGSRAENQASAPDRRWGHRISALQAPTPPAPAGFLLADEEGYKDERLAPVSAILVPPWMRPGAVLSSEPWRPSGDCTPSGYRASGFLGAAAEMRRASYYEMMSRIACEYGLPVGLFDAMIIRESRYNPTIFSPKNAFGLTQLMAGTAADLGVDRYSVEGNLRGGARYLRQQLDRFGRYHLALAAYNAGPGRVRGGMVPRIRETQDYVVDILANWARLSGLGRAAITLRADRGASRHAIAAPARHRQASVTIY